MVFRTLELLRLYFGTLGFRKLRDLELKTCVTSCFLEIVISDLLW